MVMLFHHEQNPHYEHVTAAPFLSFLCMAQTGLSCPEPAQLCGLQGSFLNLHSDLHRPKDAPLHNAHLHPKWSLLVQGPATCRGSLWLWNPGSCTLNLGSCSDCNCNWFLKSAGKSHSVLDIKRLHFLQGRPFAEMWSIPEPSHAWHRAALWFVRGLCAVMAFILEVTYLNRERNCSV